MNLSKGSIDRPCGVGFLCLSVPGLSSTEQFLSNEQIDQRTDNDADRSILQQQTNAREVVADLAVTAQLAILHLSPQYYYRLRHPGDRGLPAGSAESLSEDRLPGVADAAKYSHNPLVFTIKSQGKPLKTRLARDYEIGSNTGRRIGPQGSDGGFQPADPGDHRDRKYRTESFNLIR